MMQCNLICSQDPIESFIQVLSNFGGDYILKQTTLLVSIRFLSLAIFTFQLQLLSSQNLEEELNNEHMNDRGSASRCRQCRYNQIRSRKTVF